MRKRIIDPDYYTDEDLALVSYRARILYLGMEGLADDNHATLPNKPQMIKAAIFPHDSEPITKELLELQEIARKIVLFNFENKEFWYLPEFFDHQVINRPSKSKYPEFKRELMPQKGLFEFAPKLSTLTESSVSTHSELIKEVKEIKKDNSSSWDGDKTGDNSKGQKIKDEISAMVKTFKKLN